MSDTVINGIKDRIEAEHRKHKDLDWALIAAKKIYSTYVRRDGDCIQNLDDSRVCSHPNGSCDICK